jgi:hypothetical protein
MSRSILSARPSSMSPWLICAMMMTIVISLAASRAEAGSSHDSPQAAGRGTSSDRSTATTWAKRDRAAYVVSTLNLPLCVHGRRPTTVLRQRGARHFDVTKSNGDRYLYFIEVRRAANRLISVYAYTLGSALPTGVQDAPCVRGATSQVIGSYQERDVVRIARFSTTIPS